MLEILVVKIGHFISNSFAILLYLILMTGYRSYKEVLPSGNAI